MIRVTVELVPLGEESLSRIIGMAIISNDGTGSEEVGNYKAAVSMQDDKIVAAEVKGFNRKLSVWHLLSKVLNSYFGAESE